MKRRALYILCAIPLALIAFVFLTVLFIPNETLKGVLVRGAGSQGYTLELVGFRKRLPLGVKADAVLLSNDKGPLLRLRDVKAGLEVLPLLVGKPTLAYRGRIGTGEFEGSVALGKNRGGELRAHAVQLEDIPYFATVAEAKVRGSLDLKGEVASKKVGSSGEVQLEVRGAELAGAKLGEMPLPNATYRQVRGALRIQNDRALLKSFTLDGDGIYVRLKGDSTLTTPTANSPLNLTLELMPKPEFLERQKFVFLLLTKYQNSPGVYNLPVRGTLAHPAIQQ